MRLGCSVNINAYVMPLSISKRIMSIRFQRFGFYPIEMPVTRTHRGACCNGNRLWRIAVSPDANISPQHLRLQRAYDDSDNPRIARSDADIGLLRDQNTDGYGGVPSPSSLPMQCFPRGRSSAL